MPKGEVICEPQFLTLISNVTIPSADEKTADKFVISKSKSFLVMLFFLPGVLPDISIYVPQFALRNGESSIEILSRDLPSDPPHDGSYRTESMRTPTES